jgi:hypothetical protein
MPALSAWSDGDLDHQKPSIDRIEVLAAAHWTELVISITLVP